MLHVLYGPWVDHNKATDRLVLVPQNQLGNVHVWDANHLKYTRANLLKGMYFVGVALGTVAISGFVGAAIGVGYYLVKVAAHEKDK
jgi:hypothetical protein